MNKKIQQIEMPKLIEMMQYANIPYELHEYMGGYHLEYPCTDYCVCSVICHDFSYGHEEGKLEIMGLLTPREAECDSVVGSLLATDVFARIANHFHAEMD